MYNCHKSSYSPSIAVFRLDMSLTEEKQLNTVHSFYTLAPDSTKKLRMEKEHYITTVGEMRELVQEFHTKFSIIHAAMKRKHVKELLQIQNRRFSESRTSTAWV